VPDLPFTIVGARRREVASVSCLGAIPCHILARVRTPSTPVSFCPKNPASPCPGELVGRASASPLWCCRTGPMRRPRRVGHDRGLGLDRRYPFILIKSLPPELKSTVEIGLLCRGLMSRNHGPGPWDRGPNPWDFQ
jgi:hypothetical protein